MDLTYHLLHAYLLARQTNKASETMHQALALSSKVSDHIQWIENFYQRHRKPEIARACYRLLIAHWPGPSEQAEPARRHLKQLESRP